MNRRDFLKGIAGGAAAVLVPLPQIASPNILKRAELLPERAVFFRPDRGMWQIHYFFTHDGVDYDWAQLVDDRPDDEMLSTFYDEAAREAFKRAIR